MQVTTTPSIEGRKIVRYCGVIAGEAIMGANLFKDLFASVRDIVGGRSATYEKELQRAREVALAEMQERAAQLGANAVVNVRFATSSVAQGAAELFAYGTAVRVD